MPDTGETLRTIYSDVLPPGGDNERTVDAVIERLYEAVDEHEIDWLDKLLERAMLRWVCPVRPWTNRPGERCDDCGRTQAEATDYAESHNIFGEAVDA